MGVGIAVAATLAVSGCLAVLLMRAPWLGLTKHPRASLVAAILGAGLAAGVVVIQVAAALMFGGPLWPLIVTDYFLAMGHNLVGGAYPFFWTPLWVFRVGSLTPLIPAGAAVALAAGYSVRMYARRTAAVTVALGICLLFAYAAAGAYGAYATWGGIAL